MFNNIDDDVEKGDGDVSSRFVFLNSHTIYQRDDSSAVKKIDWDADNGDVSSGYGSMNSHNYLQKHLLGIIDGW